MKGSFIGLVGTTNPDTIFVSYIGGKMSRNVDGGAGNVHGGANVGIFGSLEFDNWIDNAVFGVPRRRGFLRRGWVGGRIHGGPVRVIIR